MISSGVCVLLGKGQSLLIHLRQEQINFFLRAQDD